MPPKLPNDDAAGYFVQIDGQLRGPFNLEGLESLACLGKITPDSSIRRENESDFAVIKTTPLLAKLFPKYIERTTPANWGKPGAPTPATTSAPSRNPLGFGTAKFERVNTAPDVGQKVDVTTMLNEVRQMERDAGLDELKPERFRVSRRTRDFWIMLIAGNALLLGGGIAMQSLTSLVFAIGGMGLFTFGLLWSMYGVMDRY